ncbi:cyclic nucleotide-binding/CBS domain-containing protein (plasmid) [Rhizobium oryzihabitans]|uniref:Cyclic nucleotide-binding/CBS domain-containing protein n=1 Tax=Rhizobium oryzihabitans TaxID=2267833 RepID=A0A7L5BRF3_9HYPH|nr:DUF294 nucleotidyltransferase-like domain-containing protein [Rhizobium oryzihabitans]QCM08816.1 cyclic nucleotide-binding/CBS domain-containing protein [Agrobacterium tumefaciens]QIB41394.1 cyclic nucleotide-binding/CBS domain-containing protein [Rhizobium oryzihabitans]CUX67640.1 Cyclic nucleotide-binding protein [Agrobacterium genomosp. 5 str. CFBP 6626]
MSAIAEFLQTLPLYDGLSNAGLDRVVRQTRRLEFKAGDEVYHCGELLQGLYIIYEGCVETRDAAGSLISRLSSRDSFGERGLLASSLAATTANALTDVVLLLLPAALFRSLLADEPVFARFFTRPAPVLAPRNELATRKVGDLMSAAPFYCSPQSAVRQASEVMQEHKISCLGVVDEGRFVGIVTLRDLVGRVLAKGLDPQATPVSLVMTADPVCLKTDDLGADVLHLMLERGIGHVPVVDGGRLVGLITQTDMTRFLAISSALLIRDIAVAQSLEDLKWATTEIPRLLVQLVAGHNAHEVVTRLITDIADAVTRRLIVMAEDKFGPPPVPYLWLACGSQGRQEQTGVSDQDNCIFLDDNFIEAHRPWFERLARFVSTGLDACGYVFCPGDMMATNPRWCQPVRQWKRYFHDWVARPDPMAQMLSSVMFDLRPIAGETAFFTDLQAEILNLASANSIFVAHMISNSLKHAPPLGLLRGFSIARSGEHRNQIDMKHAGVVPVVDLARVYTLIKRLHPVNTRARLIAAKSTAVISYAGARDLLVAYDMIADLRLRNQAMQIKAGQKPDNYLNPYDMGEFERSQLRDAFVVVRTMQSALANCGVAPV